MNGEIIARSLNITLSRFRRFLERPSLEVLEEARNDALESYVLFKARMKGKKWPEPALHWGYQIHPDKPLTFKPTEVRKYTLQVDVYCTVRWNSSDSLPFKQTLGLRVWSMDSEVIYRNHLDSQSMKEEMLGKGDRVGRRVMLRYHFDLCGEGQAAPRYHIQAGGNPRKDEFCWLHEGVSVPRMPYPPMDLVLAIELIAANFFDEDSRLVLTDPDWLGEVCRSQAHFLKPYYSQCLTLLNTPGQSLLGGLWNVKWC